MKKPHSSTERVTELHRRTNEILGHQEIVSQDRAIDVRQLLHDLQTYQIELEMQNQELLHTQRKLEDSRSKYSDLYDFAPTGYFTFDKYGFILEANLTGADQVGLPKGSLKKKHFSHCVHKDDKDKFYLHLQRVMETKTTQTCEIKVQKKDGTIFDAHLVSAAVKDHQGDFNQCRTAISDITERKKAKGSLEESEARYRTLFEQASDSIVIFDPEFGEIIEFNHKAYENLGYTHEEFKKLRLSDIEVTESPGQSFRHMGKIRNHGSDSFEARHRTKNGRIRNVLVNTNRIHLHGKDYIQGIWVDITERKKLGKELLKAEHIESLGLLSGGIAHDFNNLLTSVLGNIGLARIYAERGDEIADVLDESEKATLRARDLAQHLLTFSKGGAPVKKVAFINQFIRNAANFALSGSNVRCEYSVPDDLWQADVDASQISQVINNLAINAVQAMPQGGNIKIESENMIIQAGESPPLQEGKYVKIVFTDQGHGIPEEHLPKIFDPYFTTKQKGSGLGLATASSIVKKHDGLLTVESEVGKGTTFTIYLPASLEKPVPPVAEKQGLSLGTGKVLVMDDEEVVRKVGREILNMLGYETEFAKDGHEAIEIYEKAKDSGHPFDAVIMDLTIPGGMGGKEVIEKLRVIDPDVKAVVSSGYSNDPIMSDYKNQGFQSVLTKPYRINEMSHVLQKVIMETKG